MNNKGTMSSYISIILPIIIIIIFITIDIINILSSKSFSEKVLDISLKSCLSNYNKKLYLDYGLLAIQKDSIEDIKIQINDDIEKMLNTNNRFYNNKLSSFKVSCSNGYNSDSFFIKQIIITNKQNYSNNNITQNIDYFIMNNFKHKFSKELNEKYLNGDKKNFIFARAAKYNNEIEFILKLNENKYNNLLPNDYKNKLISELEYYDNKYKLYYIKNIIEENMNYSNYKFNFNDCVTSITINAEIIVDTIIIPKKFAEIEITKETNY